MTYPVFQLELLAKGKFTPKSIAGGFKGKQNQYSAMFDGSAEINIKNEGDYQVKLNVSGCFYFPILITQIVVSLVLLGLESFGPCRDPSLLLFIYYLFPPLDLYKVFPSF